MHISPYMSSTTRLQRVILFSSLLVLIVATSPALGEADPISGWSIAAGVFDIGKFQEAAEGSIEYRWKSFEFWFMDLKPVLGLTITGDGGYWGYGGFRWDLPVRSRRWIPSLGFAVAAYERGDGKDLGGVLEFRSAFDFAYRLTNGSRIGLSVYHLSNASIYDFNPGSESLVLFWSSGR